jgi:hypothetical protein
MLGENVMDYIHLDHVAEVSAKLTELFERSSNEERLVLRFLHKDEEWRYVEVVARFFESAAGPRVIVNSRDVTENHKVRLELNQSIELF